MGNLTIVSLLDVIGELFSDEISIAVSNTDEYIYYRPSKRIDLKIKPGDQIKDGTITHKAFTTGQKVSEFIDRDIFGVPYHGRAVPFELDGKLEGCVTAIYPALTEGKSVITVKTHDGWKPIPFDDVKFLEVRDRKTHVFANDFTGTHNRALQEFEYSLPRETFIRCHRSFIVNVNHIKEIYPDTHSTFVLEMDNEVKVPVSQSYSSYFRKLLGF
ncbi:LytTR family DNA-binding domain-containing protein [Salinibacillus xinjiangensis]|uniref:LytTR family transcriptional regulator n=1 Tax=Salinibacillus xinjiangensis TaxID=1229268 RepID=A0A6G1X582_9BACI|nr:LytTR family DNA-binding domain-containing protein [Salinibacillus xinjiangensis]MRG86124.1 LytTR family transcriptional regulator [Salinibacillus xinjiangensis]